MSDGQEKAVSKNKLKGEKIMNHSLKDALEKSLSDLGVPVIYDCDFGHIEPRMTFINGCYAKINYHNGDGEIQMLLK